MIGGTREKYGRQALVKGSLGVFLKAKAPSVRNETCPQWISNKRDCLVRVVRWYRVRSEPTSLAIKHVANPIPDQQRLDTGVSIMVQLTCFLQPSMLTTAHLAFPLDPELRRKYPCEKGSRVLLRNWTFNIHANPRASLHSSNG